MCVQQGKQDLKLEELKNILLLFKWKDKHSSEYLLFKFSFLCELSI